MRFQMTDPVEVLGEVHARLLRRPDQTEQLAEEIGKYLERRGVTPTCAVAPRDQRLFWSKVDRRGPNECWPHQGKPDYKSGHCRVWLASFGKRRAAAQVALILAGKEPPFEGAQALHSCDNPPCCNPAHLRWGTAQDNVSDRVQRRRTASPGRKLTDEEVIEIRSSSLPCRSLAGRYLVSPSTISRVRCGRVFRHII